MMPDLGKYALWVLSAYGVTIGALLAVTVGSLLRAARVRRALAEVEASRRATRAEARPAPQQAPLPEPADG